MTMTNLKTDALPAKKPRRSADPHPCDDLRVSPVEFVRTTKYFRLLNCSPRMGHQWSHDGKIPRIRKIFPGSTASGVLGHEYLAFIAGNWKPEKTEEAA
jgi:hypothetical protein